MSVKDEIAKKLYSTTDVDYAHVHSPNTARLTVNGNQVVGSHLLPGLEAEAETFEKGVKLNLTVKANTVFENPVHLCFGVLEKSAIQKIIMKVKIEDNAKINVFAYCTFPFAQDVLHTMDAEIYVGENAEYTYFERHIHGKDGGVKVVPKAKVELAKGAKFKTEFELIKGAVGLIDIEYDTVCGDDSVMEMEARISGKNADVIRIREIGHLKGKNSVGLLTTKIAVQDNATADVYNELTASAPFARGHVDCHEIVQGNGIASATPIVKVMHPQAHVTHEAAIGSVDSKQLETLMARGLDEDEAVDLIVQSLLNK